MRKMVLPKVVIRGLNPKGKDTWADGTLNLWSVTHGQYAKLTKRQQRMVIAADVIDWLDNARISAEPGSYISGLPALRVKKPKDARALVVSLMEKRAEHGQAVPSRCAVCAMGAVFLTTLVRVNTLKVPAQHFANTFLERAARSGNFVKEKGAFNQWQQRVLEACFEGWCAYNLKMDDPTRRLRSLMMNLIRNKGKLVLHKGAEKRTDQRYVGRVNVRLRESYDLANRFGENEVFIKSVKW